MYKPTKLSSIGPSGVATLKFGKTEKGKQVVAIAFDDENVSKREVVLNRDLFPESVQKGKYFITLTSDNKGIYAIRPVSGAYTGKVARFSAREGENPVPKQHPKWNYQQFTVILEIVGPRNEGMEVPCVLHYNFGEIEEEISGGMHSVVALVYPNSKHTAMLEDFLSVTGAWNKGAIKYSDNILPTLQKRILQANKEFQFVLKDGWVNAFVEGDGVEEDEEVIPETKKSKTESSDEVTDWGEPEEAPKKEEKEVKPSSAPWEDIDDDED